MHANTGLKAAARPLCKTFFSRKGTKAQRKLLETRQRFARWRLCASTFRTETLSVQAQRETALIPQIIQGSVRNESISHSCSGGRIGGVCSPGADANPARGCSGQYRHHRFVSL